MAQGKRDSVGSIVRLRRGLQIADAPNHIHDLLLLGPTIADNGLLYLKRRVFVDLNPGLLTGKQYHAASVSNGDTGRDIGIEKKLFDGYRIRLKGVQELGKIVIDLIQPTGKARMRRRGDNAAAYQTVLISFRLDQAETDRCHTGVYAKNTHAITSLF